MKIFMSILVFVSFSVNAEVAVRHELPKDAADLVKRIGLCEHWSGKNPFSGYRNSDEMNEVEKSVEIDKMKTTFKCDNLEKDTKSIRKKYIKDPQVIEQIRIAEETEWK